MSRVTIAVVAFVCDRRRVEWASRGRVFFFAR